ncbi:MAG: bacterioferritin [Alphaproteobacteria bacterium]|nr:bacterioferritin [Alphaproteobacteria bacterium]
MTSQAHSKAVIKTLNVILKNELTAINQYFLHAKMLKHLGFAKLAATEYEESIDEMKHADQICERILLIGGIPNLQDLGKLHIGELPQEMLASDLKLEEKAHKDLLQAIEICEAEKDITSSNMLQDILASEELHYDWLRKQLDLIKVLGVENYLQTQV